MIGVRLVGALAVPLVLAGCAAGGSGSSPTTTSSSAAAPSTAAMAPMTPAPPPPAGPRVAFRDYLASIDVTGQPARFDQSPGLTVTVPVPDGWTRSSDPVFATGIDFVQPLGGDGTYPSVTLMTIKLAGQFDPKDAILHANADALPPNSADVTESFAEYQGFPSAVAQGVSAGAQHYSRIVLADVPSTGQRYLVQLTATTRADQPIAASPPLSEIVSGFTVAVT